MSLIPLGPFDLIEPIGRGGMGEVWRGLHRAQQVPVAIKVLTARGMRRSFFLVAFRNEVRAMAGLDHPGIALVFDHGEVSEAAADQSEGALMAGSPFLAMELAHGGTLSPWCGRLAWMEVRKVLLALLDALAHAHARGVIHRDLKPANVLICTDEDLRPGIKLADFGLAHLLDLGDRTAARGPTAGTPHYMAPEQVQGRRRDYGPWTDLYSLGRLALALVWSNPAPAPGKDSQGTALPLGFDAWVSRLLQPQPEDRFQRAADAALALMELGDPPAEAVDGRERPALQLGIAAETFALTGVESSLVGRNSGGPITDVGLSPISPSPLTPVTPVTPVTPLSSPSHTPDEHLGETNTAQTVLQIATGEVEPSERRVPPTPASWRRPQAQPAPMRLVGAGLGIYGLRAIPLVDREPERDVLWEAMSGVRQHGRAAAVVLTGPAGAGKSRLAEWLCERSHEVGTSTPIRVTHAPLAGPGDGIASAIGRFLRCADLERAKVLQRLEVLLRRQGVRDQEEWHALTELICPAMPSDLEPGVQAIQFSGPVERWALIRRALERASAERPTLLWMDDVQWGLDSVLFAEHMLAVQDEHPLPVLMVLTARDEALAERPSEADALEQLLAHPQARRLPVSLLEPEAHAALVRGLLGLQGELAASVEARTAGNPMFAVQLVGDWVHRGLLEPSETGFKLKPGARADLPDLLHKVWAGRVESVLRGRPASQGVSLELAAVLGQEVVAAEWSAACALEGITPAYELVDELLEQRLARAPEDRPDLGWSFAHGMIRESLERRARDGGRWWAHQRAASTMLKRRLQGAEGGVGRDRVGRLQERLGRHLLAAGDLEDALEPLLIGAHERFSSGDYAHSAMLLSEWDRAVDGLELRPGDPRRAEGLLLRCSLSRVAGRLEEARRYIVQVQEIAERAGLPRVAALALLEQGKVAWNSADTVEAIRSLQACEQIAGRLGDRGLRGRARLDLGNLLRWRGERAQAASWLRLAVEDMESCQDAIMLAYCQLGLGEVARTGGQLEEAKRELERAYAGFERMGSRRGMADCLNTLGEIERASGDLERAEERYRASLAHFRALEVPAAFAPESNLALLLILRERYAEARRIVESILPVVERGGRQVYRGYLHAYLLPCTAAAGDWPDFTRHLNAAREALVETRLVDADIAEIARLAADLCLHADQRGHARAAWELALDQWQKVGRTAEAAAARRALRSLR